MAKITVQNTPITVIGIDGDDYISLTDMTKSQLQEYIIFRWLSLKGTIEYLGDQMRVLESSDNDHKLLK